jgi:hypothetical protein
MQVDRDVLVHLGIQQHLRGVWYQEKYAHDEK